MDVEIYPDSKVHGAILVPPWVLSAPDGPHERPMNLATRVASRTDKQTIHRSDKYDDMHISIWMDIYIYIYI